VLFSIGKCPLMNFDYNPPGSRGSAPKSRAWIAGNAPKQIAAEPFPPIVARPYKTRNDYIVEGRKGLAEKAGRRRPGSVLPLAKGVWRAPRAATAGLARESGSMRRAILRQV